MASLPARQASQRRSSPEQTSSEQPQSHVSPSPVRTRSEDSQTLFLNKPESTEEQEQEPQSQPHTSTAEQEEDGSAKKCWICFSDSTEDTPTTSPWRSPCPCALVAHEECLLDWIADMESPTNTRRNARGGASLSAPPIQCPQCKAEIKLARPRNVVVDAVRGMERLGSQLITPGALFVLSKVLYNSSMAWGVHSIYAVFGAEDGFRILRPLIIQNIRPPLEFERVTSPREIGATLLSLAVDNLVHWRLYFGLPLITPMLVLSRTKLADAVLPVLPILFFATQTHAPDDTLDFGSWPPSASLSFAVLPYVRAAYNIYYQKVWSGREKQWLKEMQPRVTQQAANEAAGGNAGNGQDGMDGMEARDDDDNVFEVRIDGGIWEDWEEEPEEDSSDEEEGAVLQQPNNVPAAQQNNNAGQPNAQQQPAQNQPAPVGGGERRLSFSPTAIAETVLGALLFPAIAGMSGELLKLALPRALTTPAHGGGGGFNYRGRAVGRIAAKGLLQEKWGRSLVGGCLFVVLKDAVMLYVRWKMAQMHKNRRVVDWEGKRKGRS